MKMRSLALLSATTILATGCMLAEKQPTRYNSVQGLKRAPILNQSSVPEANRAVGEKYATIDNAHLLTKGTPGTTSNPMAVPDELLKQHTMQARRIPAGNMPQVATAPTPAPVAAPVMPVTPAAVPVITPEEMAPPPSYTYTQEEVMAPVPEIVMTEPADIIPPVIIDEPVMEAPEIMEPAPIVDITPPLTDLENAPFAHIDEPWQERALPKTGALLERALEQPIHTAPSASDLPDMDAGEAIAEPEVEAMPPEAMVEEMEYPVLSETPETPDYDALVDDARQGMESMAQENISEPTEEWMQEEIVAPVEETAEMVEEAVVPAAPIYEAPATMSMEAELPISDAAAPSADDILMMEAQMPAAAPAPIERAMPDSSPFSTGMSETPKAAAIANPIVSAPEPSAMIDQMLDDVESSPVVDMPDAWETPESIEAPVTTMLDDIEAVPVPERGMDNSIDASLPEYVPVGNAPVAYTDELPDAGTLYESYEPAAQDDLLSIDPSTSEPRRYLPESRYSRGSNNDVERR